MDFLFPNVLFDEPNFLIQGCFNCIRNRFNHIRNALDAYLMYVYGRIVNWILVLIFFSLFFTAVALFVYLIDLKLSRAADENSFLHVYLPLGLFITINALGFFFVWRVHEVIANLPYSLMTLMDVVLSLGISGLIYYISVYVKRFNLILVVLAQLYALFFLFLTIYTQTILDFSLTTINIGVAITFLTSLDPDKTKSQKDIIVMGIVVLILSTFIYLLKNIHVKTVENSQAEARSEAENNRLSLVQNLEAAQSQVQNLNQASALAKSQIRNLNQASVVAQSQIQNLNQDLGVAQSQIQNLNQALAVAQSKIQNLNQSLAVAQTQVQNLNQALTVAQTQAQIHDEVLATAKETAKAQEIALAEAQIQIEALFQAQMEAQFLNLAMEEVTYNILQNSG